MTTRPDIAQALNTVSKLNATPNPAHLNAVKRIILYLKGTVNLALKYEKLDCRTLVGFLDADWTGDQDHVIQQMETYFWRSSELVQQGKRQHLFSLQQRLSISHLVK